MEHIFHIENLTCAYQGSQPVLRIPQLSLPRGRLIFVVGRSGVGKSTFIETLGLMNRTILPSANTSIRFSAGSTINLEIKNHWNQDNAALSAFRRQNFSFIFQNTNLMPNFSSGENMMVSLLLQGRDLATARGQVLEMMERLDLPERIFDAPVAKVSGGQRQRLAFVRAITADFQVLFGDEPTGNLDSATAANLMRSLRALLRERDRTGIVVSHDLNLAFRFADVIVPLRKVVGPGGIEMGETDNLLLLHKSETSDWRRADGTIVSDPTKELELLLSHAPIAQTNL
jgi:ABC-type lipoprotein export system ATPase subunit